MMTPSFLQSLAELVKLLPQIRELCTRQPAIQEAIVTNNGDPTGLRRVRVTREAQGGQSESDWIPCGRATSFSDEPIPEPGTQCLIALVGGDPHKPFFLRTLSNASNPPDSGQTEPTKDNTTRIPGNDQQSIGGDRTIQVSGELQEEVGGDCYLVVKGEKYSISADFGEILLSAMASGLGAITARAAQVVRFEQGGGYAELRGGFWTLANANGQKWTMGGSGPSGWQMDLGGQAVDVINCSGFSINGKQVIVVGATDSRGDVNNSRGY